MSTIGIIGTAGRRDDAARLDRAAYDRMYDAVVEAASEWGPEAAVSGGAAYADHLAVRGYLDGLFPALTLYLPSPLAGRRFADAGDGRTANHYMDAFAAKCGLDPFAEIAAAIERGARIVVVKEGFKARNLRIGREATHLLAFTFGSADAVQGDFEGRVTARKAGLKDGGTSHCWDGATSAVRRHVDLTLALGLRQQAQPKLF